MTDPGTYIEHEGRPAVRFERAYPHPIERVWTALTDPGDLSHWFPSSVEHDGKVGGAIRFADDPHMESTTGEILAFDPPRRFAYTWGPDELHFWLEPAGEQRTQLTMINVLDDRTAAARNASGWEVCLGELDKVLAGTPSAGPHSGDALPWEPVYESYVASGMPSGAEIPGVDATN